MRFSYTVAALAAAVSAAPTAEENVSEGYTIHQEASGRIRYKNGPVDMMHVYVKYGKKAPADIEAAYAAQVAKGSVQTVPENHDEAYLTPTLIGSPAKKLMLDIDTGSSDLWVFSSELPAREQAGHTIYNPSQSTTSKQKQGYSFSISYGDGSSAAGNVFTDKVSLGGVTVQGQAVEAAERISRSFQESKPMDGLFGFGFSNINEVKPKQQMTWISNAAKQLKGNLFCANLRHNKPGSYDIGFINDKHHLGSIHYTKISRANGFWQFNTGGFYAGNDKHANGFNAIADTGTSMAFVPLDAINAYYRKVPTARYNRQVGGVIFKCNVKLPSFSVIIGGSKRTIPGNYINYAFVGTIGGKRYCIGGLQQNTGLEGMSILGDTFLKSQYVVFDAGENRIGFAGKRV